MKRCPRCLYKVEQEFREALETYFQGIPFLRKYPKWLRYKTKYLLELDGYNKNLKIAFEYQGEQHYKLCYLNGFSEKRLKEVQEKDFQG